MTKAITISGAAEGLSNIEFKKDFGQLLDVFGLIASIEFLIC